MCGTNSRFRQKNYVPTINPSRTTKLTECDQMPKDEDEMALPDSVRMYLSEISQIPLLRASEELELGRQIELASYLKKAELLWHENHGHFPDPPDLVAHILEKSLNAEILLTLLRDDLEILPDASPCTILYHPLIRKSIDGRIPPELVNRLAIRSDLHPDEVYRRLVEISLNSRLLPPCFICDMESRGVLLETTGDITWKELLARIQKQGEAQSNHFDRIRAEGIEARTRFIQANLRLVVSIAKTYPRKVLPLLDMIQEGNIGLMKAVDKYDHRKGNKFSTYATLWIKQAIHRGVSDQSRTIRLPVRVVDLIQKYLQTKQDMAQSSDDDPVKEDIASTMNIAPRKLDEILETMKDPVSLESPIGDGIDRCLSDVIIDYRINLEESVSQLVLKDQVGVVLQSLPERENTVLCLRYGFENGCSHTLEEIGNRLKLTRERIRQIEKGALNMVKSCALATELRCYTED